MTLEETKRLDELYREKVKLTEQELGILHNPPDDVINKVGILKALVSQEDTQAPGRGSAASKQRGSKRSTVESEAATVDSPGPSPSEVRSSDQLRRVKGQGQRSSSVASQTPRDSTSKLDDGSEGSRTGVTAERVKLLVLHAEVAYRQSKTTHDSDGERIHCTINGIRKDKARYATMARWLLSDEPRLNTKPVAGLSTTSRTRMRARISSIQPKQKICFLYQLLEASFPPFLRASALLRFIPAQQPSTTLKSSACSRKGTSTASSSKAKRMKRRSKR